jgi:hypothetical protein
MRVLRVALALILVPLFLFCAFGFLASFESPDYAEARVFYATLAAGSLLFIVWAAVATIRGKS